ncbi:oligosaccharide flippase family protein [Flexivirga sp.]|uniref:oligosaccharide flippase family protein n=1 Tax=Flexivirga sp. TaxID=1962927 RepID=UPI002D7F3A70|nr:oligosaccharide flippase family protein [Flexivirga sp.]
MGALLGVAMGMANALGYLVVMLLSRPLGPGEFGGYTALSTYGVLLAIPAGVFQVVVARRLSGDDPEGPTSAIRPALLIGLGCFAVTAALSPALAHWFHLPSFWAAVLLGGMLVPMMVTGCFQGILLGRGRLRTLSLLYLANALTRVVAASVCAFLSADVTGVFAAMLVAGAVTAGYGAWLCRVDLAALPRTARLAGELIRSNSTLAAYVALTNVDMLLARHFLTPHESGGYALASTFARAMCWGTQFVALIIVPRMQGSRPTRTLLRASGVVAAIGVVGFGIVAISPQTWITVAGGPDYEQFGHLALLCVVLGVAWALAQVWLFSEMGSDTGVLGALTWAVIVVEILAIALVWHDSPTQVVWVCMAGAFVVALSGLLRVVLRHQATAIADESVIVAADSPRA